MALTAVQEGRLLLVLRERFPDDTGEQLALRVIRFMVRNNPSAAQKAAIQAVLDASVADRDAQIAAFDGQAALGKATLQAERAAIAAVGTDL
jgi:hypothetical protein